MSDQPVYSTARPANQSAKTGKANKGAGSTKTGRATYQPSTGPLKMRLETKGRGGKAVTVLFNLPFADAEAAQAQMRAMQAQFGCGAAFKDATIELRGDVRDRVAAYMAERGIKVLKAGG